MANKPSKTGDRTDRTRKYLTFRLAQEVYGLDILKVQEIIGMMNVTRIPRLPEFIRGVINLRGMVIPVVDLRLKFDLGSQQDTDKNCIIVVQISSSARSLTTGVIVDEVSDVMDIGADQIEPPPSFGHNLDTAFLLGMAKVNQKVILMLDIDRALTEDDLCILQRAA